MFLELKNRLFGVIIAVLCTALAGTVHAEEISKEYQIKAAVLIKLTQFFSWGDSGANNVGAVKFCLLQPEPFGPLIETLALSSNVDIIRVDNSEDISICHILFVSQKSVTLTQQYADDLLLITENHVLSNSAMHLNIFVEDSKVKFEANIDNLRNSKLRVNPLLLNVAKIVKNDKDRGVTR